MNALNTANFAHPSRNVGALGVEPGMKIADFGSGSGAYVLAMAERMANAGHVYAIDIQQDLLRKTKNEAHKAGYKNVQTVWGDLERPNGSHIADAYLDLVLISNLLFQVEEKARVLEEARRVLKPVGRLAIIDWSESFGGMGPQKSGVVKKERATELSEQTGFIFQSEFPAGAHHYGLLFKKDANSTL